MRSKMVQTFEITKDFEFPGAQPWHGSTGLATGASTGLAQVARLGSPQAVRASTGDSKYKVISDICAVLDALTADFRFNSPGPSLNHPSPHIDTPYEILVGELRRSYKNNMRGIRTPVMLGGRRRVLLYPAPSI